MDARFDGETLVVGARVDQPAFELAIACTHGRSPASLLAQYAQLGGLNYLRALCLGTAFRAHVAGSDEAPWSLYSDAISAVLRFTTDPGCIFVNQVRQGRRIGRLGTASPST